MIKWILLSIGFIAVFAIVIWYVTSIKKTLKDEEDAFENATCPDDDKKTIKK